MNHRIRIACVALFVVTFIAIAAFELFHHTNVWYARRSKNINAQDLWAPTREASLWGLGHSLIWGAQKNGDVFDANGFTITITTDPGSTSVETTLRAPHGGIFTVSPTGGTIQEVHTNIIFDGKTVIDITPDGGSNVIIDGNVFGGIKAVGIEQLKK